MKKQIYRYLVVMLTVLVCFSSVVACKADKEKESDADKVKTEETQSEDNKEVRKEREKQAIYNVYDDSFVCYLGGSMSEGVFSEAEGWNIPNYTTVEPAGSGVCVKEIADKSPIGDEGESLYIYFMNETEKELDMKECTVIGVRGPCYFENDSWHGMSENDIIEKHGQPDETNEWELEDEFTDMEGTVSSITYAENPFHIYTFTSCDGFVCSMNAFNLTEYFKEYVKVNEGKWSKEAPYSDLLKAFVIIFEQQYGTIQTSDDSSFIKTTIVDMKVEKQMTCGDFLNAGWKIKDESSEDILESGSGHSMELILGEEQIVNVWVENDTEFDIFYRDAQINSLTFQTKMPSTTNNGLDFEEEIRETKFDISGITEKSTGQEILDALGNPNSVELAAEAEMIILKYVSEEGINYKFRIDILSSRLIEVRIAL